MIFYYSGGIPAAEFGFMKCFLAVSISTILASVAVQANTINAPSSLIGYESLNGQDAYSWNVDPHLSAGQDITAATITFSDVTLNVAGSTGHGYLYTDLLNSQAPGLTTRTDNDAPGDYWATQFSGKNIDPLGTEYFSKVGKTLSWSYVLDGAELTELNSYLAHGSFNIGIDPDCHFSVGCIDITYDVGCDTHSVPDATTTLFLLGSSLLGLEVVRRKLGLAR